MSAERTTTSLALATLLALLAPGLSALETGWLELKEGHQGQKIKAKVQRIKLPELGGDGGQHVTVTIPRDALENTDKVHQVVVVGKRGDQEEILPGVRYEWAEEYENNNYGLIIKLDKLENYPIRVYLNDDLPLPENR
ncbi:hypothetical protein A9Q90_08940 [Gammaproteobacteria bacterium 54_18_T64]|nr:hypothetical protein A9Q90_08940 [Gammaproteobacteria bacterium 54_18_T64]